ncbi:dynamin family protein [Streptomyces sp. NPDC006992]|uniref:dynamin family protein n=1 Tax=Streptomyces sp. NPDC006992 TaxID=3155601 RepID=UPI0033D69555
MNDDAPAECVRRLADMAELLHEIADVTDVLEEDETAGPLRAEADLLTSGTAVAVCAGEKKRGKSTLINALVEHPGLLPADADVASNVHVRVRHGEPGALVVRERDPGDPEQEQQAPEPEPIPLDRVAEFAALDPDTQQPRHEDVHHLDITVPAPLLRPGLALVDTPGVGGLVSGHAALTMATLRRADALVFVVDGSSELTRSELDFLVRATGRIATVVFVLTKTDLYPRWRDVMERNRGLLAEHAPRYAPAPWFAVSSAAEEDALTADRDGDPDTAERRRATGGIPQLRSALGASITERVLDLRAANAAQAARAVLDAQTARAGRLLDAASGDLAPTEEIERLRNALLGHRNASAGWRRTLGTRLNRMESDLQLGFRRAVNDLRAAAEDRIAVAATAAELADLPEELHKGVEGCLMELETGVAEGVRCATEEIAAEIDAAVGGSGDLPALAFPDRLRELTPLVHAAHDQRGPAALLERLTPTWGAGMLVSAVVAVVTGGLFAPITAGFGTVAVLTGRRRRRDELTREREDARRYLRHLESNLNTEVPPMIRDAVEQARQRLGDLFGAALDRRAEELAAELRRHRELQSQETERTEQQTARIRARCEILRGLSGRLEELAPASSAQRR